MWEWEPGSVSLRPGSVSLRPGSVILSPPPPHNRPNSSNTYKSLLWHLHLFPRLSITVMFCKAYIGSIQYTVHMSKCTMYSAQYTMYSAHCTVYSAQYGALYFSSAEFILLWGAGSVWEPNGRARPTQKRKIRESENRENERIAGFPRVIE